MVIWRKWKQEERTLSRSLVVKERRNSRCRGDQGEERLFSLLSILVVDCF